MKTEPEAARYSPFSVRSYRFQWPADLCASWGFEMEIIVLGWYVLVETQSVLMLSIFGALQYFGTMLAPMSGVLGHRMGNKRVICAMRGWWHARSVCRPRGMVVALSTSRRVRA
jgi:hypothetical protein